MVRNNRQFSSVLIAGPTASGKSALALRCAQALGGTVLNADSMQVYRHLPILTAQPPAEDIAAVPHRLYGHVDPAVEYSASAWMKDVEEALGRLAGEGRPAIIVGGTGLYFRALLGGIDAMPEVAPEIREHYRARMAKEGAAALHDELRACDAEAAQRIRPSDPQRIVRALELAAATGGPLSAIQKGRGTPLVDEARALKIVLTPPREELRKRIAARFAAMMAAGALGEAEQFRPDGLNAGGTAAKAIGLAELLDHLAGRTDLATAIDRAIARSRQYAKRQETWFRHQLGGTWRRQEAAEMPDDICQGVEGW